MHGGRFCFYGTRMTCINSCKVQNSGTGDCHLGASRRTCVCWRCTNGDEWMPDQFSSHNILASLTSNWAKFYAYIKETELTIFFFLFKTNLCVLLEENEFFKCLLIFSKTNYQNKTLFRLDKQVKRHFIHLRTYLSINFSSDSH